MKYTNDTSLIQTYLDYCKYNKRLDEKPSRPMPLISDTSIWHCRISHSFPVHHRQLNPIFLLYIHYTSLEPSNGKSLL